MLYKVDDFRANPLIALCGEEIFFAIFVRPLGPADKARRGARSLQTQLHHLFEKEGCPMNSLVIYFSKFGNTQKVADAIGETLRSACAVRVVDLIKIGESDLKEADLIVMGVPTHRMNLPEDVKSAFEKLPRHILRHKSVAGFDTSYKMSWWLSKLTASRKLLRNLKRLGGKRIVPPETFHVVAREGPMCDGEIERAGNWARQILSRVESHSR